MIIPFTLNWIHTRLNSFVWQRSPLIAQLHGINPYNGLNTGDVEIITVGSRLR
jgi:hypothetical protein